MLNKSNVRLDMSNKQTYNLPLDSNGWSKNDMQQWPHLVLEDLYDYLILSKAYDGKEMRSFRALWGHNYVNNNWIGDIYHIKDNDFIFLKAFVSPSQPGVDKSDYLAWICVNEADDSCRIETASCSCPAGLGRACSHVSAIAYTLIMAWNQGIAGQSCTDLPVTWGKGAKASTVDHQEQLKRINFSRPSQTKPLVAGSNVTLQEKTKKLHRFTKLETHNDLKNYVSKSSVSNLWHCSGTLINHILSAKPVQIEHTNNAVIHGNHDLDYSRPVTSIECAPCRDFYQKYIDLSNEKIDVLCTQTENQNSDLWLFSRKIRIPASKVHSIPKTKRADPEKFVNSHLYPRFKGSKATQHGKKSEPIAREQFKTLFNCNVACCGTVIDKSEKFLSASPDGIIDSNTVLEIKCPQKCLQELVKNKTYDVLKVGTKYEVNRKGKNGYFYQIQMQLHCTERKLCKFYIWTDNGKDCACIDVEYNPSFMNDLLPRLREFYYRQILTRIVDEYSEKRLKICEEYSRFCQSHFFSVHP